MPNRRLSTAEDIELADTEFKNDNWEQAAQEILEFWDDGLRTFVEMDEAGTYSRSMYSNVVDEHFAVRYADEPQINIDDGSIDVSELPIDRETFVKLYRQIHNEIYREGFRDGANWAQDRD